MITNPKNLAKIVKYLEKTFDGLLHQLDILLKGDFITSLMEMMHMQMEVHVYANDARDLFIEFQGLIDAAFFCIFLSVFLATVYALVLSLSAVGYLYGYCRCCASMCTDPDGYLKEDEYKPEGPCLSCFPNLRPPWMLGCCRCCKEKPDANAATRVCCKGGVKCGNCCRSCCCELKNAYRCATFWINTNFLLLLIPMTIACGLIVAAFILWYGSCYGINIMTEAICKMLHTYSAEIGIDMSSIAVCSGQGPCDTVTKSMPIAAGLVGGGTMLMFLCQYQILGTMWKNYYFSQQHRETLTKLQKEVDDVALEHRKRWDDAHPEAEKLIKDQDSGKE
jgi:hypothetical protein